MRFDEYEELVQRGVDFGIDGAISITGNSVGDLCVAGKYLALPLAHVSPRYKRHEVIEVVIPGAGGNKNLCFLLTCKGTPYSYSAASALEVGAFLTDARKHEVDVEMIQSGAYTFRRDYVLVHSMFVKAYCLDYLPGSYLWGGYYHEGIGTPPSNSTRATGILAAKNLRLPTAMHERSAARANSDPSAFGRFLALYHLIELSFDFDLINEIKALPEDLKRVGKLLATFDEKELSRLNRLVKKYWTDETTLMRSLTTVFGDVSHSIQLEEMLFDYGKEGFPWGMKDDEPKRVRFLTAIRGASPKESLKRAGCDPTVENLQKAISYIIYRFRCAIAHASIGECILTPADDLFIETVGEPLVFEFLKNMYSSSAS